MTAAGDLSAADPVRHVAAPLPSLPAISGFPALAAVHKDGDLLVVNKPAGLVCHPTKGGPASSLIGRLRLYLGGAARPQLIHRLDRETSGLVVVALTAPTARDLRQIWETRRVRKTYLAIVHGVPPAAAGEVDAPWAATPPVLRSSKTPSGPMAPRPARAGRCGGSGVAPRACSASWRSNP